MDKGAKNESFSTGITAGADSVNDIKPTTDKKGEILGTITPELRAFYDHHNVGGVDELLCENESSATSATVRFIRLNPRFDKEEILSCLRSELEDGSPQPTPIPWLDDRLGFYAVPGTFNLSKSPLFRSGRIYGMDVSSGAAVAVLLSNQYDDHHSSKDDLAFIDTREPLRVLDLCCAPGLKLCTIADALSEMKLPSVVLGVDISQRRISLCKNIVKKYHVDGETSGRSYSGHDLQSQMQQDGEEARVRLYCEDGTTFGTGAVPELVFDSKVAEEEYCSAGKRKKMNKSARSRERKRLRQIAALDVADERDENNEKKNCENQNSDSSVNIKLFDRVLVDAECSTDGSLKHVQQRLLKEKMKASSQLAGNPTLTDTSQLKKLVDLQKRLILSGFRLLKPGGILVYSTCSLSEAQNEGVVSWLLGKHSKEASVIPVSFPKATKGQDAMIKSGSIPGTVRFKPSFGGTAANGIFDQKAMYGGGFFLSKIMKKKLNEE